MDTLADSPLIPASILFSIPSAHPPTQGRFLYFYAILVSVWWSMAMLCMAFCFFACPCPNRASGKGEAYFLVVFSLSLFLVFGSCYRYLPDISDAWWLQVSCCGRSLLVHSAGVTLRPSRHPLSLFLVCSLDAFPLPQRIARLSLLCLLHASLMRLSGQIRSRAG